MGSDKLINVTNHEITVLFCDWLKEGECTGRKDGQNYTRKCRQCPYDSGREIKNIEPSGVSLKATPKEELHKVEDGVKYITIDFVPNEKSKRDIEKLDDGIYVGGVITAQAFPERVVAMVPVPGYERVPLDEKLVRSDKFSMFLKDEGNNKA